MATAKQTTPDVAPSTKVLVKGRFSYVHVFEATRMDEKSDPKYSVNLIIPKTDKATIEAIKVAVANAAEAGKAKLGGKVPLNLKTPLRDGDVDRSDDPTYAGAFFLNASTKTKPGIVDKDREPILDTTEFYSGCYGRASINMYAFNTAGNKGVAAGLNNVQKLEDGEALAGRSTAEEDFADEADDIL